MVGGLWRWMLLSSNTNHLESKHRLEPPNWRFRPANASLIEGMVDQKPIPWSQKVIIHRGGTYWWIRWLPFGRSNLGKLSVTGRYSRQVSKRRPSKKLVKSSWWASLHLRSLCNVSAPNGLGFSITSISFLRWCGVDPRLSCPGFYADEPKDQFGWIRWDQMQWNPRLNGSLPGWSCQ